MIQMKDNVKEKNRKDLRNISETGMMEEHSPLKVMFSIVVVSLMILGAFAVVINTGAQGNTVSSNAQGHVVKYASLFQVSSSPNHMISGTLPYMPPGAVKLSTINLNMTTNIFMGMKLQHNTFLNAYLAQVSNPASPIYRHYLTHSQFVNSFEVNSTVYDQIASYYSSMGLTVVKENDRGYMEVSGSLLNLQKAFNTTFAMFSTNLGDFYFNLQNISVPSAFSSYINTARWVRYIHK